MKEKFVTVTLAIMICKDFYNPKGIFFNKIFLIFKTLH